MATANTKCFTCNREARLFICEGCSEKFCRDCLSKHLQKLDTNLEEIKNDQDQFREKLNRQKKSPNEHPLIKEINQWEKHAIAKIEQTARTCREQVVNYTNKKYFTEIERKLNDIAKELEKIRQKNQFNEIDLDQLKENLNKLQKQLEKPSNIKIQQDSSPLVQKISIVEGKFVIKI
jgi:chromosome segregation ATPase